MKKDLETPLQGRIFVVLLIVDMLLHASSFLGPCWRFGPSEARPNERCSEEPLGDP